MYNRVDLYVTIHKPILLGGLVMFSDKNKKRKKTKKTKPSLRFEIRFRFFKVGPPPPQFCINPVLCRVRLFWPTRGSCRPSSTQESHTHPLIFRLTPAHQSLPTDQLEPPPDPGHLDTSTDPPESRTDPLELSFGPP